MLYVVFTQLENSKIVKFEKIPFPQAVKLSQELEMEMREKKQEVNGEFYLLEEENNGEAIYSGTFKFGSYFAPNLFVHIKKKLPVIKTSKEKEKKRLALMAELEELVEEDLKKEEDLDSEIFGKLDKSKVSRLKRWQRRTIYGLGALFALSSIGILAFFFIQISAFNNEYQALSAEKEKQTDVIDKYQNALLGEEKTLNEYLSAKKLSNLKSNEKRIYAGYLADEKKFSELVDLYGGDPKLAATFLSNNKSVDVLKEFNEDYPTNEAKFDIAYAEEDFNKVLSIQNVEMTTQRSEKKTYAFLKTGNVEEAKAELENNNSDELSEKIAQYEQLNQAIADINKEMDEAKDDKKDDLEEEKEELQTEIDQI
ncbi:hypothetical protein [Halobacillus litoralis]|uniref:hypothetical protein n=1 Tax=Halobacillus litoralis TaxID=45668 RepID=UPI00136D23BB|nr:hypothetical protein [Halobacillus litoralis]MYL39823.1 hypothetical protein [Halobacillus litoralis]